MLAAEALAYIGGSLGLAGLVVAVLRVERTWAIPLVALHLTAGAAWFVGGSASLRSMVRSTDRKVHRSGKPAFGDQGSTNAPSSKWKAGGSLAGNDSREASSTNSSSRARIASVRSSSSSDERPPDV
ncbi:MAG: hypothetical protein ACRDQ2_18285 [Gaiellales bacterium]